MEKIINYIIIPINSIPGSLTNDNIQTTTLLNLMKFFHAVHNLLLVKLCTKFHQTSFNGLIMGQKTLVWSLRYDPTQHRNASPLPCIEPVCFLHVSKLQFQLNRRSEVSEGPQLCIVDRVYNSLCLSVCLSITLNSAPFKKKSALERQ